MPSLKSRLATAFGLTLFFGGIVLLAFGIPTRRGVGYELVFGMDAAIPGWAFALSFLGGPAIAFIGAVFGMRYGHFERYHKDYDPETGSIASNHPFARLHERVTKPGDEPTADDDHPEKFVMNRTHLALLNAVCMGGPLVYLFVMLDFMPLIRWMIVAILGGGAIVSFIVTDRILQDAGMDYDASW